jgi:hypothetical protein
MIWWSINKLTNKKLHWALRALIALVGLFFIVASAFCFNVRDFNNYYFPKVHHSVNYFEFVAYILLGIYAIFVSIAGRFFLW